jgi:hypothetical protein
MDSSVSPKEEIWYLRVCHHISNAVYLTLCVCCQRWTAFRRTLSRTSYNQLSDNLETWLSQCGKFTYVSTCTETLYAGIKPAKMGHGPHSSKLVVICVVLLLLVLFYVLFVFVFFHVLFACKRVLYHCHRVLTQLQLTNISYHIVNA